MNPQPHAPGKIRRTRTGYPYRVDVYPGTHTAVTFRNIGAGRIVSNNLTVVDSNDSETWLDPTPNAPERTIYYHVRHSNDDREDTTLFLLESSTAGTRAVFQVRRVPYPPADLRSKGRVLLRLNGLSVALNQDDGKVHPYNLTENVRVPNDMSHQAVITRALEAANGRMIDNLVVNAHGVPSTDSEGRPRAVIQLGDHFHPGNVGVWDRLHGRVRFIWLQNCVIGFDIDFLSEIARRTGAWVSAPSNLEIATNPQPAGHMDLTPRIYVHFNGVIARQPGEHAGNSPRHPWIFYRAARVSTAQNLDPAIAFSMPTPP